MSSEITPRNFLEGHTLSKNIFITGMFYSGITIYNQQIRSLNLIYHLIEENKIKPAIKVNKPVVILGGGIAGLTIAIALKKLKYGVVLLEEKSLLLHLQHGCSTRQVHPNLFLWPQADALKPFTELPFANWRATDAAGVEKQLKNEFKLENSDGSIKEYYNIDKAIVKLTRNTIDFKSPNDETIVYSYLIIATGFGLEQYVGRKEKTKSYWRNEDLSQLRLADQIKKFFVSGTGDGGISDVCRLALIAFDPTDWAKKFNSIDKGKLIADLRGIENKHETLASANYYDDFQEIFKKYKAPISKHVKEAKRTDIEEIVLNGEKTNFGEILVKGGMSFFNAWMVFVIFEIFDKSFISYHKGQFPSECGKYLFTVNDKEDYITVIRHGTDKNWDRFKALNKKFEKQAIELKAKQRLKQHNAFSIIPRWPLKYWKNEMPSQYSALTYAVSPQMNNFCSVFLYSLEGLISNFIKQYYQGKISYRATVHRLIYFSKEFFFQQLSEYVGDRKGLATDVGRVFPVEEGVVGMAMRTNSSFTLIKDDEGNTELFSYSKIFARPLGNNIKSFLIISIPFESKNAAAFCLYIDTDDKKLVLDKEFRKFILWVMTSFIEKMNLKNASDSELREAILPDDIREDQISKLKNTPGIFLINDELQEFWAKKQLIMSSNKLIDIYDE